MQTTHAQVRHRSHAESNRVCCGLGPLVNRTHVFCFKCSNSNRYVARLVVLLPKVQCFSGSELLANCTGRFFQQGTKPIHLYFNNIGALITAKYKWLQWLMNNNIQEVRPNTHHILIAQSSFNHLCNTLAFNSNFLFTTKKQSKRLND